MCTHTYFGFTCEDTCIYTDMCIHKYMLYIHVYIYVYIDMYIYIRMCECTPIIPGPWPTGPTMSPQVEDRAQPLVFNLRALVCHEGASPRRRGGHRILYRDMICGGVHHPYIYIYIYMGRYIPTHIYICIYIFMYMYIWTLLESLSRIHVFWVLQKY